MMEMLLCIVAARGRRGPSSPGLGGPLSDQPISVRLCSAQKLPWVTSKKPVRFNYAPEREWRHRARLSLSFGRGK